MIHFLKGNMRQMLYFSLMAGLLLFLYIKAQPVNSVTHNLLSSEIRELQSLDIKLGESVLQDHYQLLHNYDEVVSIMQRMQELDTMLHLYLNKGWLPDSLEIRKELGEVQKKIEIKAAALDEFKSNNAVSKTAYIYLPTNVTLVKKHLASSNIAEMEKFNRLLQDTLLVTINQGDSANKALQQDIAEIVKTIPTLPVQARALAILSSFNAENIFENESSMGSLIMLLSSNGNVHIGTNLEQLYQEYYQNQQYSASQYRLFLLLVAMMMLGYALYNYYAVIKNAEQLRIAATAFETRESLLITDVNGVILRVNHAFTEVTGYTPDEAIGQTPRLLKSGLHDADFYENMWEAVKRTGKWEGETWDRKKNGEVYPAWLTISSVKGEDGIVSHYVGSHVDITERKASEEKIRRLAFHDPLTDLPNRQLLLDRLHQALATYSRSNRKGALLFIDLDNFKSLNDTLGHAMGDLLLQQVAQRLVSCVREGDTVSRLGGDEFVVVLQDLSEKEVEAVEQAETIGAKILASLNQPYQLDKGKFRHSGSIGVILFSGAHQEPEELLKQADIAMYQSKTAGRNTLRFFDPRMQEVINNRVALESELRKAIDNQQFHLHYQVQVDNSRRPIGAEVLIRWMHPEQGMVSPAQFIPLAEETGLIIPIGNWVLHSACAQISAWQQDNLTLDLTLAVNVSAKQFRQADFVSQVEASIQHHGIIPRLLKLELTESLLLEDVSSTVATMRALKEIGVQFSLDDFGTGYSSLQYLKQLPLNQIKIDQSFVRDIAIDQNDAAIVQTILAMAETLGFDVIAEGVETEAQRDFLDLRGCHAYQGYLFGKPMPIEQFESLLKLS
jgi:diguanylate cyclase (GGDEF)-like protein/PAS domain S-box-containing protein